ncbi:NADPH:quinone oxidoreductase family protein [Pseudonocardia ailaonensis]|uniref:NADPH:quinone oxidoreductase family protein n=1 Tax=Pseudonocardia ailaonensis TaxID=367279 RepID=A0ABN2N6Y8_9PSEU
MRAYRLDSFGGPRALRPVVTEEPAVRPGRVVVRARAIGINHPDLLTTRGRLQGLPSLPAVPGREVAGIVAAASPDTGWLPGDAVCGYVEGGAYAELVDVPGDRVVPVPRGADFGSAVALVINFQTAHFALRVRGGLVAGERVLVLGAAGGIGSAAVQIARASGARVVAGVATAEQVPVAVSVGADDVVVLGERFSREVLAQAPDGVDLVVDPLGGSVTPEALRCLAPEGRLLVLGFAAGSVPTIGTNRLLLNNTSLVGVAWNGPLRRPVDSMAATARELGAMVEAGTIRPHIGSRFRFEQLPEALLALEAGSLSGKAVVELPVPPDPGIDPASRSETGTEKRHTHGTS